MCVNVKNLENNLFTLIMLKGDKENGQLERPGTPNYAHCLFANCR